MRKLIAPCLLLLLVLVIFHSWFISGLLISYDIPFYSSLMMNGASLRIFAWDWHPGFDGFAGFFSPYSWVFPLIYVPQVVLGNLLGMDWAFIERVVYLYPLLILLIFSPVFFFKTIFPKNEPRLNRGNFYLISVLVFSFNTYSLLLAGGEVFVALSYALIPVILGLFYKIVNAGLRITDFKKNINFSVILGLVLALQVMLDPRVTYVTIFAILLYLILNIKYELSKRNIFNTSFLLLTSLVVPLGITALLHSFWILPSVLYGKNPVSTLGSAYSTTEAVRYLSFAKFEQTISLLQQNWPDNIFGKVDFMKPEFLLLPILAFSSLLFIKTSKPQLKSESNKNNLTIEQFNNRTIIFFALLGLIGAFLSKGANDPFGGIYLWVFEHVPGFIMFRDPAKWYPLVAISYSALIPFSIWKIYEWLSLKRKFSIFNFQNIFLFFAIFYLLFLIRPAVFGQLGGMFKTTKVPQDYVNLEKFLYNQPDFFRTLWVPSKQHFGYYSNTHPEMSAQTLFNVYDDSKLFRKLSEKGVEKLLEEASVKYIIVPLDSEKEIFITDRKYDNKRYQKAISRLQDIKWLKEVRGFGKIAVFEIGNPNTHFWSPSKNLKIYYNYVNPIKYLVSVNNAKREDRIVFGEAFDSKWVAGVGKGSILLSSIPYQLSPNIILNSFIIHREGSYSFEVYYEPQKWVDLGTGISLITFSLTVLVLSVLSIGKKL